MSIQSSLFAQEDLLVPLHRASGGSGSFPGVFSPVLHTDRPPMGWQPPHRGPAPPPWSVERCWSGWPCWKANSLHRPQLHRSWYIFQRWRGRVWVVKHPERRKKKSNFYDALCYLKRENEGSSEFSQWDVNELMHRDSSALRSTCWLWNVLYWTLGFLSLSLIFDEASCLKAKNTLLPGSHWCECAILCQGEESACWNIVGRCHRVQNLQRWINVCAIKHKDLDCPWKLFKLVWVWGFFLTFSSVVQS